VRPDSYSMRRASELECRRLNDNFAALCAIPSPSRKEGLVAEFVRRELEQIGLEVEEDDYLLETYWMITVRGSGGLRRHVLSNWRERPSVWSLDLSPDNTGDTRGEETSS
ncbi:hypothetical protein EBU60_05005, partial [bacterium]|nr:hypothetical protein [bacterium]